MRLEFHPEAERELSEAAARYEAEVVGLGRRFAAEVHHLTELLIEQPLLGTPIDGKLRGFALRRFSYNPVYSAAAEVLTVPAVADQHRRPGYWRDRLSP